jgi:hypothetical protein
VRAARVVTALGVLVFLAGMLVLFAASCDSLEHRPTAVVPPAAPVMSATAAAIECAPGGGAFLLRFEGLRGMAPRETVTVGLVALGQTRAFVRLDTLGLVRGGAWSSSYSARWSLSDTTGGGRSHAYVMTCVVLPATEDSLLVEIACTGIEETPTGRREYFEVRLTWRGARYAPLSSLRSLVHSVFRGHGRSRTVVASLTLQVTNPDGSVDAAVLRPKGGGSVVVSRSWYERGCP